MYLFTKIKRKIIFIIRRPYNRVRSRKKIKYFCIGHNKTGTTSLKKAFLDLGYPVGNQREAEVLTGKYYFKKIFLPIVKYCRSAQVFQDVPFSYPETYKVLDKAYPHSKFILTIRDDPEQWYNSLTRFHSKLFGKKGALPTINELEKADYIWPGFMTHILQLYGTSRAEPYEKAKLIALYEKHNNDVIEYFKNRPDDLLVLNLSDKGSYKKFVDFLGVSSPYEDFPWENKT